MTPLRRTSRTAGSPPASHRFATPAWLAATLLVVLALGLVYKLDCRWGLEGNWLRTAWCYSDAANLWDLRGFDVDALPYAGPPSGYPVDYVLEYPPVLAFGLWAISLTTGTRHGFVVVGGVITAIMAVLTLWLLDRTLHALGATGDGGGRGAEGTRRRRLRLFGFAASPSLLLLGFQNWDLWSIAPAVAGVHAAVGRRPVAAGAWLGLAAGVKWWPALLVPLLLVGPWADGRGWRRFRPALSAAGVWALTQVPALLVSVPGWWASIAFHLRRGPNRASAIGVFQHVAGALSDGAAWVAGAVDALSAVGLVVLVGVLVAVLREVSARRLDPLTAAVVVVATFLVTSKVVSVQFILWLLPLAVLAGVPWRPVLLADLANAAVWILWAPGGDEPTPMFWSSLASALVRTGLLAWIVVRLVRERAAGDRRPAVTGAARARAGG